ncbi:hypothetical protein HG263_21335 [Pseudoalteromonas sp. JBTF-M23]|uniref:Peptidase M1 membrane alanine aminopeptidase domain-containing protein n=1 Tax=Pseudoalteromonas caenipelagi TaxID=2726988 RepID=A0A849VH20_9GAMM|nr:M1 family aminopeptidase [Pseudoalteromonas caenipelagi]NOU53049.1 hypothetical protein [Pseudoalteromonas caenipelagi]
MLKHTLIRCGSCIAIMLVSITSQAEEASKVATLENVTINYHFMDDESVEKKHEINDLTNQAFSAYTKLFGGLPRDEKGKEYSEITIHVNKGKYLGGEADPKLIMLSWREGKTFGFATWQTILLHELFHLWSGESIRYQDGREHWFNEGFSEFYAYKTAVELGLISSNEMLAVASSVIGYYLSASRLGELSMRDAGRTNKAKFDNYFLVYSGGWTMAMALDHDIRKRTNNNKSIDNLMPWLYSNFHRDKRRYTLQDINQGIRLNTELDYSKFLDSYVDGNAVLPISEYLPISDALWALTLHKKNKREFTELYETLGIKDSNQIKVMVR